MPAGRFGADLFNDNRHELTGGHTDRPANNLRPDKDIGDGVHIAAAVGAFGSIAVAVTHELPGTEVSQHDAGWR